MTNKTTKEEMFNAIKAVIADEYPTYAEFIDHELELLHKRSAAKAVKDDTINTTLKGQIVSVLALSDNPMRTSEIAMAVGISSQKAQSLLKSLTETEQVKRTMEKKVPLFSL